MSEYENKEFNAEIVAVKRDTQLQKRNGGTYPGTELIYEAFNQINKKGIHEKTFEIKPELKAQIDALNPGDKVTIKFYRKTGDQYWNLSSITQGQTAQRGTGASQKPYKANNDSPNPAAVGQALNLAVELGLAKTFEELLRPEVARAAIDSYKEAKELYAKLWDAPVVEKKEAPAPSAEEDVPF